MSATPPPPRKSFAPSENTMVVSALVLAFGGLIGWLVSPEPNDGRSEVAQARAHLQSGRPDLAYRTLAEVDGPAPGGAEVLTLAGQAFLRNNQIPSARRAFERALKLQPDQAEALKPLAAIYLSYSEAPRAITLLERAARLDPGDFRPWYALGKAQAGQGQAELAATAFEAALDRQPPKLEVQEIRIGLARALLDAGRADTAESVLTRVLADSPDDPQCLGLAARQARDSGDVDSALKLADRTLLADPTNLDALLTRARENQRRGHPEAALPDLENASSLEPDNLATLQLRLQVESRLGLTEKATETGTRVKTARERKTLIEQLARRISQQPNDPEPRWKMGQAALKSGQTTLAAQCFQAALDLDPKCQPALDGLASLPSSR